MSLTEFLMDCREFREKHVGFVDDTLPAVEMRAMQRHLHSCCRCSRHDTAVRRSLLVAHNLPMIEPSADFMERLEARLREVRVHEGPCAAEAPYARTATSFGVLAAAAGLVAYVALTATNMFAPAPELRMPPVVATAPEPATMPLASPALVAAASAGMPVWPAVMMADQAPMHMANAELIEAALR